MKTETDGTHKKRLKVKSLNTTIYLRAYRRK